MAAARQTPDDPALHRTLPGGSSDEQVARTAAELVVAELVRRGDLPPSALQRRDDAGAAISR